MTEIDVVRAQAPEAGLDGGHVLRHRRTRRQVPRRRAELGGDEQLVAHPADRAAHGLLAAAARVVRRGVEVVDAAVDREARDLLAVLALDPSGAEHDVRHVPARAPEPAVALHARVLPLLLPIGVRLHDPLVAGDVRGHAEPAAVPGPHAEQAARRAGAAGDHERAERDAGARAGAGQELRAGRRRPSRPWRAPRARIAKKPTAAIASSERPSRIAPEAAFWRSGIEALRERLERLAQQEGALVQADRNLVEEWPVTK